MGADADVILNLACFCVFWLVCAVMMRLGQPHGGKRLRTTREPRGYFGLLTVTIPGRT